MDAADFPVKGSDATDNLFVYSVGPIDRWGFWVPFCKIIKEGLCEETDIPDMLSGIMIFLERATFAASMSHSWEGDIVSGPYLCALPRAEYEGQNFIVAWKQHNNGTTFIASPVELPWLAPNQIVPKLRA